MFLCVLHFHGLISSVTLCVVLLASCLCPFLSYQKNVKLCFFQSSAKGMRNLHILIALLYSYCKTLSTTLFQACYMSVASCSLCLITEIIVIIKIAIRPVYLINCRPGSSVGIATGYGLDGPEIESRYGEIFRTCPDRSWGPLSPLYSGYRVFPEGRKRPGRDADPHPLLEPRSKNRVELYLYSP
jgi:hypothetical protein